MDFVTLVKWGELVSMKQTVTTFQASCGTAKESKFACSHMEIPQVLFIFPLEKGGVGG